MVAGTSNFVAKEIVSFNRRLSFRALVKGIDYYRHVEYKIIEKFFERIVLPVDCCILDIGSGEEPLASYLLYKGFKVTAIDLDPTKLMLQRSYFDKSCRTFETHAFLVQRHDCRNLGFATESFDLVFCLALCALIPDNGDTLAVQQICRVLNTNGYAFISLPFTDRYMETNNLPSTKVFSRVYDWVAIQRRLIGKSDLQLVDYSYFGEGKVAFSKYWYSLPFLLKLPFRFACNIFSEFFLSHGKPHHNPSGIMLILKRKTKDSNR